MKHQIFGAMAVCLGLTVAAQGATVKAVNLITTGKLEFNNGELSNRTDSDLPSTSSPYQFGEPATSFDWATSNAFQNDNFISRQTFTGEASSGKDGFYRHQSDAIGIYDVTNDFATPDEILFDFSVSNISMRILGGGLDSNPFDVGANRTGENGAKLSFSVFEQMGVNGPLTPLFEATYEFWQYRLGDTFGSRSRIGRVENMNATITPIRSFGPFINGYSVNIDNIQDTVDLGSFAAGETKRLVVWSEIDSIFSPFEIRQDLSINDPGDTYGIRSKGGPQPSAVPLPAGGWLLLVGLAGLAGLCRKRA